MTATVATLLDDIHARTWDLCSQLAEQGPGQGGEDHAAGLLAGWSRLASAALHVLNAVRMEPVWLDDTAAVREALQALADGAATGRQGDRNPASAPSLALVSIATRLGAIGDLVTGQPPACTEVDRAALVGLQANVVGVVHAVAVATLAALDERRDLESAKWLMRGVLIRTERFAVSPVDQRAGRYEDVAAVARDGSLDAAITGWVRATVEVLTSRQRVTQSALQMAAGDALILIATAGTAAGAAAQLSLVPAEPIERAQAALALAHGAWRPCVAWPTTVRLLGVRDPEQLQALRQLRQLITDSLRDGRGWLPAETLAERFDLMSLMGSMRRGLHAVGNVAVAQFQAMDRLVRGPEQLWIAANAVTQPAYQGYDTVEAACRRGWVPMPPGEPTGGAMLAQAKQALASTMRAVAALDATAAAPPAHRGAGTLRWDRGRIVVQAADDHRHETVRAPEPAGARSERRVPVVMSRRDQTSPRP